MKHYLKNISITYRALVYCVILSVLLPACNSTKFLQDDEVLLTKAEITIVDPVNNGISAKQVIGLKEEMVQFYYITPNTNTWYGVPREYLYFKKYNRSDSLGREKLKDNKRVEEPALLDNELIEKTAIDMQNFLKNKQGFYNAKVDSHVEVNNNKATVEYTINTGIQYQVKMIEYISKDSLLIKTVDTISQQSLIKVGDPVDALHFSLEKQRIVTELQNRGYANFNLNYIGIEGDSTSHTNGVDIRFNILAPGENRSHTKFKIGDIEIFTDYHQFQNVDSIYNEVLHSKEFFRQSKEFLVRPSVINNKIFLKKYQTYSSDEYYKTIRKLYTLNTYRFAKVTSNVANGSDDVIDYRIFLTPQRSRWVLDLNSEFFYSNISRVDQNLVGIAAGTSLENRNTFRGSETYTLGLESGVELNVDPASSRRLVTTFTLGVNNNLDLPRMTNTFNAIPALNKVGIISDKAIKKLREEGSTQINAGYNYIDIVNFYRISSLNATYGYDFKLNNKHRVVFNQIGLNISFNDPLDSFQVILDTIPLLEQSFQSTFFSGLIFRDISYYYQSEKPRDKINYAFISNLELSGLEIFLANKTYNAVSGSDDIWRLSNGKDFAKFIKLDLDHRWYKGLKRNSQLAWRIRTGIGVPFGEQDVVSWLKQFSIGGPNSLRSMRPMELGPGTFIAPGNNVQNFFQRGDILIEFGAEYRFDLFWLVEGALFFDGGNIWTLKEDADRPGAKFSSEFLGQIALGYGYGIRFDFTYFLIRFDFGFRLKNPSRRGPERRIWEPLKGQRWYGNLNVAVNYPF
ncbi:BamA/TamA family outer membrane protein [Saprospiraceae bacterium]|nr:BamA/TamA family outer membrane protein [Saprospiraceae bacterium]